MSIVKYQVELFLFDDGNTVEVWLPTGSASNTSLPSLRLVLIQSSDFLFLSNSTVTYVGISHPGHKFGVEYKKYLFLSEIERGIQKKPASSLKITGNG